MKSALTASGGVAGSCMANKVRGEKVRGEAESRNLRQSLFFASRLTPHGT